MANQLKQKTTAPDFELTDTRDRLIRLSDYRGKQPVVLVLTRGFV